MLPVPTKLVRVSTRDRRAIQRDASDPLGPYSVFIMLGASSHWLAKVGVRLDALADSIPIWVP
jgi:hypothetical protein